TPQHRRLSPWGPAVLFSKPERRSQNAEDLARDIGRIVMRSNGQWGWRWAAALIATVAALAGPGQGQAQAQAQAQAQDYPHRTVTLVVPSPPGGGVDVLARVVAEKLSGVIGQQVIVDNRVGGSGLVGTRTAIRSAPDGYTLFFGHTGSISINPSLYANAG